MVVVGFLWWWWGCCGGGEVVVVVGLLWRCCCCGDFVFPCNNCAVIFLFFVVSLLGVVVAPLPPTLPLFSYCSHQFAVTVYLYCTNLDIHEGKLSYLRSLQVSRRRKEEVGGGRRR